MITQITDQDIIEKEFGKGWRFLMNLTQSNCEIYERGKEVLYCFYDGDRKGEITKTPWREK